MKRAAPRSRTHFMDQIMAEHVYLPGVAHGFIVTRHYAYQWLKACGYNTADREEMLMVDRMVFLQPALDAPLTDLEPHAAFLAAVQRGIRRDCLGLEDAA